MANPSICMEIESSRQLLGLNTREFLSGCSRIRNKVLAYVFKTIGFIEAYGTGIDRMISNCRVAGHSDRTGKKMTYYRWEVKANTGFSGTIWMNWKYDDCPIQKNRM